MRVGMLGWVLEKVYENVHCGTRYLRIPLTVPTAKVAHSLMNPCGQGPEPPTTVSFQQTLALCEVHKLCHTHFLRHFLFFWPHPHVHEGASGSQSQSFLSSPLLSSPGTTQLYPRMSPEQPRLNILQPFQILTFPFHISILSGRSWAVPNLSFENALSYLSSFFHFLFFHFTFSLLYFFSSFIKTSRTCTSSFCVQMSFFWPVAFTQLRLWHVTSGPPTSILTYWPPLFFSHHHPANPQASIYPVICLIHSCLWGWPCWGIQFCWLMLLQSHSLQCSLAFKSSLITS